MGMYFNLFPEKAEIETDLCYVLPNPDRHTFYEMLISSQQDFIYSLGSSSFQNISRGSSFCSWLRCVRLNAWIQ